MYKVAKLMKFITVTGHIMPINVCLISLSYPDSPDNLVTIARSVYKTLEFALKFHC